MKQPPDFTNSRWTIDHTTFYYFNAKGVVKQKKFLLEDLPEGSKEASNSHCFGYAYFYGDPHTNDYSQHYQDFSFNPDKEGYVIGAAIYIFFRPVLRYLAFLSKATPQDNSMRTFCWYMNRDSKWQFADIGDTINVDYVFTKDGLVESVKIDILDMYESVKDTLQISNPRL